MVELFDVFLNGFHNNKCAVLNFAVCFGNAGRFLIPISKMRDIEGENRENPPNDNKQQHSAEKRPWADFRGTFAFSGWRSADSSASLSIQKYPCCYRMRVCCMSHDSSAFSRSSPGDYADRIWAWFRKVSGSVTVSCFMADLEICHTGLPPLFLRKFIENYWIFWKYPFIELFIGKNYKKHLITIILS